MTGPSTPETATVAPTTPPSHLVRWCGVISGKMTILREYKPDPPTPWSALHAINALLDGAKPQPMEAAKKITKADMYAFLRPMISAMRAKRTTQPRYDSWEWIRMTCFFSNGIEYTGRVSLLCMRERPMWWRLGNWSLLRWCRGLWQRWCCPLRKGTNQCKYWRHC